MGAPVAAVPLSAGEAAAFGNHDAIVQLGADRGIAVWFVDYPFQEAPARALAPAERLPAGARSVATVPALRASGLAAQALFLDNNHLTAAGNAIVGAGVADTLAPTLGPATPP